MERRLAAVMIADVAGYGRLSQADEEGTRARFQSDLQDVFEPKIAEFHGRLVKTMGDGLLVEFRSVVDSLRCAVEIQRAKAGRESGVPADRRLQYRIGINLGDVIVEGDDIHGDGVNIADRLQKFADPAGITISGTVYDQIGEKLALGYQSLGEQRMKSIEKPVRVYRVLTAPKQAGRTVGLTGRHRGWLWPAAAGISAVAIVAGVLAWQRWELGDPPPRSIAVLPFESLSDAAEQGYLADGITDDLTTDLARIPGLFVVSRNAAIRYKDQDVEPAQIAAELGVRYLLEGSIRRLGDELRINVQLIDAANGGHLWAERFDGAWSDVFTVQNRVIVQIADALELRIVGGERAARAPGGTDSPAAYDAYLQGLELFWRDTPEDAAKALLHLKAAITLDPNYGAAYAALAKVYRRAAGSPEWERALGTNQAKANAQMVALLQDALKHPSPSALRLAAELLLAAQEHDAAIANLERAIALDPSDYENYAWMAWAMNLVGHPDDAQLYLDTAMRLDPRSVQWLTADIGVTQFCGGRIEEAAATLEKDFAEHPDRSWSGAVLVAAYGHLGRDARSVIERLDALDAEEGGVGFTQVFAGTWFPFKHRADAERLREGLRKAGVPELPFGYDSMSEGRLKNDEIKATLFGHTLQGRDIDSGATWTFAFAADGAFTFTSDSRWASATSEAGRVVEIEDGVMCWGYPATGARGCGALFRVPETAGQDGDLLWIAHIDRILLSVVE